MCQSNCQTLAERLEISAPEKAIKRVTSQELLAGLKEIFIEHEGCCYCLRLTRQNKLILTK